MRWTLIVGSLIYIFSLTLIYTAGVFNYPMLTPAFYFVAYSWIMAALPSLWLPLNIARPSQFVCWMLYILVYVPATTILFYAIELNEEQVLLLPIALLVGFGIVAISSRLPLLNLKPLKIGYSYFALLLGSLYIGLHMLCFSVFGLPTAIPGIFEVYDIRYDMIGMRDGAGHIGALAGNAARWLCYIFNPVVVSWGLIYRNHALIAVGIIGILSTYALTGFKTALFMPLMVFAVWFMLRSTGERFGIKLIWGAGAFVVACTALALVFNYDLVASLFVRRLILVPGLLTSYYYEFFTLNPQVLMSDSRMFGWIFGGHYPYPLGVPHLIGATYFGWPPPGCNANIWASAYAQFGFYGIIIFSAIFGIVLWIYDSLSKGRSLLFSCLLMVGPCIVFSNSNLIVAMIGHGAGWALVLMYITPIVGNRFEAKY